MPARLLLAVLAALLVASALVPIGTGRVEKTAGFGALVNPDKPGELAQKKRPADLVLYDRIIERIQDGEHYYDFVVSEQRAADYPVRPGLAVRLPTLAYINAWLREPGLIVASIVLMMAILLVWWRKLGGEQIVRRQAIMALAMLAVGASLATTRHFFVLHELWAGMLLALSFGLHRPGKWGLSLAVAALALAIRELALPFVLLMGAMAFYRDDRREGLAWSALSLLFVAMLAVHLQVVAAQVRPDDPHGQGWIMFRGLSGWLSNIVLSSNLRFLAHWIAGPLVILATFGWTGWKSPTGLFGTFLYLGYGLFFMIAGRGDNYYWGMLVAPPLLAGLAFVPMATKSLLHSAFAR